MSKIIFALRNGKSYHISHHEVCRGQKFECFECGEELCVKDGGEKVKHFSHIGYRAGSCGAGESATHKGAKYWLADNIGKWGYYVMCQCGREVGREFLGEGWTAMVERAMYNFRPDVVAENGGSGYRFIEVCYTRPKTMEEVNNMERCVGGYAVVELSATAVVAKIYDEGPLFFEAKNFHGFLCGECKILEAQKAEKRRVEEHKARELKEDFLRRLEPHQTFVVGFGNYNGWTIQRIYNENPSYLNFLAPWDDKSRDFAKMSGVIMSKRMESLSKIERENFRKANFHAEEYITRRNLCVICGGVKDGNIKYGCKWDKDRPRCLSCYKKKTDEDKMMYAKFFGENEMLKRMESIEENEVGYEKLANETKELNIQKSAYDKNKDECLSYETNRTDEINIGPWNKKSLLQYNELSMLDDIVIYDGNKKAPPELQRYINENHEIVLFKLKKYEDWFVSDQTIYSLMWDIRCNFTAGTRVKYLANIYGLEFDSKHLSTRIEELIREFCRINWAGEHNFVSSLFLDIRTYSQYIPNEMAKYLGEIGYVFSFKITDDPEYKYKQILVGERDIRWILGQRPKIPIHYSMYGDSDREIPHFLRFSNIHLQLVGEIIQYWFSDQEKIVNFLKFSYDFIFHRKCARIFSFPSESDTLIPSKILGYAASIVSSHISIHDLKSNRKKGCWKIDQWDDIPKGFGSYIVKIKDKIKREEVVSKIKECALIIFDEQGVDVGSVPEKFVDENKKQIFEIDYDLLNIENEFDGEERKYNEEEMWNIKNLVIKSEVTCAFIYYVLGKRSIGIKK